MSDTNKPEETKKAVDQVINGQGKPAIPPGVKTFDFSKEDQDFLQPRQVLINQKKLEIQDLDYAMQRYIIENVLTRLAIDPKKFMINFNVSENKIRCTPRPPEILVPPKDIVIPGKPKN